MVSPEAGPGQNLFEDCCLSNLKKKFDSLLTLFLTLTIVKLASYLVSIAVSYIHPSTLTIVKLTTYLVSIAVSFIHPSAFLFLPDITKLSL